MTGVQTCALPISRIATRVWDNDSRTFLDEKLFEVVKWMDPREAAETLECFRAGLPAVAVSGSDAAAA